MARLILGFCLSFLFSLSLLAEVKTYKVEGMTCGSCAASITSEFKKNPAVKSVDVDVAAKSMKIDYKDGKSLSDEEVKKVLSSLSYELVE